MSIFRVIANTLPLYFISSILFKIVDHRGAKFSNKKHRLDHLELTAQPVRFNQRRRRSRSVPPPATGRVQRPSKETSKRLPLFAKRKDLALMSISPVVNA